MIRTCRFDLIQYLLFPDDNTQCQPFDQLFHHEIQERNLVETDSCRKMEDCHISYDSIVCMLELPMLAQGLDRCMNISQGVSMYMEAITILTIIHMQGYLSPPNQYPYLHPE